MTRRLVIVPGVIATLVSLLGDSIGVGQEPGFGWKQSVLLTIGLALVLVGLRRKPMKEDEHATKRGPILVGMAALGIGCFGILTIVTSKEVLAPTLLYDGASYVELAQQIRTHWYWPPPSFKLRPPLYPSVIAVAGWLSGSDGLATVVNLQILAWLMVGVLVMLWVYRLGRNLLIGCIAGCLYYTLGVTFLNVKLIYAETLTVALSVAGGFALTCSMLVGARSREWRCAAAALALASAYARPIFQLLLPLYAAFAVAARLPSKRAHAVRLAAPFVVAGVIGLLPIYVAHAVFKGSPAFVPVVGYCMTNYLGDRRLLGRFPPGFETIEAFYSSRFAADPGKTHIAWWDVADDWARDVRARTGSTPDWFALQREMGSTAVAVLARNPTYYVRRWLETWLEFSTFPSFSVSGSWSPIKLAQPGWVFYWAYFGAWSPFVIMALEVAVVARRGPDQLVRLVPIVTYLVVALANTAIEPWPGQVRYRSQVEVFLVIALGLVVTLAWDWVREQRGEKPTHGGIR